MADNDKLTKTVTPSQTPATMPPTPTNAVSTGIEIARPLPPIPRPSAGLAVPSSKSTLTRNTEADGEPMLSEGMQRWLRESKKDGPWSTV
ncbi:hypothetical protein OQA88_5165 [Cercophora sp. LCS_1]